MILTSESETLEAVASAEERAAQNLRLEQSAAFAAFDAEDEYRRQTKARKQSELLAQSSGSHLLPGTDCSNYNSDSSVEPFTASEIGAALRGTGSLIFDTGSENDFLANRSVFSTSLGNNQGNIFHDGLYAGTNDVASDGASSDRRVDSTDLGTRSSDGRDLSSSAAENVSLSLSSSLRSSLDDAECTAQETQQIQDDLEAEAEKQKQVESEAAEEDFEMEIGYGLSM